MVGGKDTAEVSRALDLCAKLLQSSLTLCNPMDYSPLGSSVHGDSPGKNTGVGSMPSSRGSSHIPYISSVAQLCPILCDPMDCSTPGFPFLHHLKSLLNRISTESVVPSKHLIRCLLVLLLPSIFPSTRVFSNESALASGGQNTGASALVLPMNIQDGFYLELTSLISFLSNWFDLLDSSQDSQESSPTPQFKSINSLVLSLLCGPTLTSIQNY